MKSLARLLVTAAILFVASCGGGGGGGGGSSSGPTVVTPTYLTQIVQFSIASQESGLTYPITVWSPPDAATGVAPPVIYILDADYRFAPLLDVLQQSGVRATLVGVGDLGADRRQVDFLEPGADSYYRFITQEVLPTVESRFRVDPARRVLSGHSSGGLFAMYAFFSITPQSRPFFAILAEDGSYWQQPDLVNVAEAKLYAANPSHDIPVTLIMGGDQFGNLAYMDPLYQQVLARHYTSLKISERSYAVGHLQMDAPFMTDVLPILFPNKN